ncbi:MAG: DUF1553 domain-containing protein [Pirellulales bacterium]
MSRPRCPHRQPFSHGILRFDVTLIPSLLVVTAIWSISPATVTSLKAADTISYNRDVRPILSDKCFACHGPDQNKREGDLRLDDRDAALRSAIIPGNASASPIIKRIETADAEEVMPPPHTKKSLSAVEVATLKAWINSGAAYEAHWAFVPVPQRVPEPEIKAELNWIRNPIDRFVAAELDRRQWQHAPEASRETWLRRVSFDLTGLPPSLEEIDNFLADRSDKAYERVVDRLSASPEYGERMAADWLDAARYADTFGYQSDREMHVWPWRDWVIKAFNDNLPYDRFLLWQLAGDMLPDATREQRLATAFNRLHRQTNEGGSIEQEFRIEYVADRVRTMGTSMLGLTLECARCHDHKYDPIHQREYYGLQSIFNNIDEHGLYSHFTETAPTPTLLLYEGDQEDRHRELLNQIADKRRELDEARAQVDGGSEVVARAIAETKPPEAKFATNFDDRKVGGDMQSVDGRSGKAIQFGGDDALTLKEVPQLSRTQPFSVSLWVRPHEFVPRAIVAHQSRAAEDSAFRGFSLVLDSGVPVVSLIHFWPGNAISVRAKQPIAIDQWTQIGITYDGGSRADGLNVFIDGLRIDVEVVRDKLTRDFTHLAAWGDSDAGNTPFALGARFRDVGFKNGEVDDLAVYTEELSAMEMAAVAGIKIEAAPADRSRHAALRINETCRRLASELHELHVQENELVSRVRQIMTMEEMSGRRPTFVLARGAYDAPTVQVPPSVPQAISPGMNRVPQNRLEFAQWVISPQHPLTARVAVNRYWRIFFGQGLVSSVEDFGNQGDVPSHPELLDWLARQFVDEGWNVRELCKRIVLSATYRQSSTPADASYYGLDPSNRYLTRGPRHRLSAEQVRDNALAASGLLVRKLGGPSVYPYQPAGVWEDSGTGKSYNQSKGPDLYRRSMYSFWRRTSPPPSMTTFDAPSREFCMVRRERTATPMQALTLLNDTQFVEAARVISERVILSHPDDMAKAVSRAFRMLTSRSPSAEELKLIDELRIAELQAFAADSERAKKFVSIGESPRNESIPVDQLAAMTTAVQLIMSFDECVTKR